MKASRVLIVGVNWVGDLIFMTPAIRAIRRAYPASYIACLIPPRGLDLLRANPHLDAVIPFRESRGLTGLIQWWPLVQQLRRGRFDTAFLFHPSATRAAAVWAAGIPSRIGYRTGKRNRFLTKGVAAPVKDSVHKAIWYLGLVEGAGLPSDGLRYDLAVRPEDRLAVEVLLKGWGVAQGDRLVALHPGANWRLKRWPAKNFASLADRLSKQFDAKVIFVGSGADLPLVEKIRRQMQTQPLVATGRTSLCQLGALLSRVRLLVSNDSGPLHLGSAVGTPVIGLFGPTDPKCTGPIENGRSVTLFGSIGCPVPCYRLECPANLCMNQITVEQVLEAAGRFLK